MKIGGNCHNNSFKLNEKSDHRSSKKTIDVFRKILGHGGLALSASTNISISLQIGNQVLYTLFL